MIALRERGEGRAAQNPMSRHSTRMPHASGKTASTRVLDMARAGEARTVVLGSLSSLVYRDGCWPYLVVGLQEWTLRLRCACESDMSRSRCRAFAPYQCSL